MWPVLRSPQQGPELKNMKQAELLLKALAQPIGFHKGKPLAALLTFRTCLQWGLFQAEKTSYFDQIIQVCSASPTYTTPPGCHKACEDVLWPPQL